MSELDKYRPPDYDNPTGPFSRWAFLMQPQLEQADDRSWRAWYPGADWRVTAADKDEAVRQLQAEFHRRENTYEFTERVYGHHLQEPIPGIYAMDIGLCNELSETESDADLDAAFEVAERYRQAGKTYTKADYQRGIAGRERSSASDLNRAENQLD